MRKAVYLLLIAVIATLCSCGHRHGGRWWGHGDGHGEEHEEHEGHGHSR